ncbi:hypothetical protein ECG_04802 [Echinococcus granulosus]|nr:hypothetical protein ECG_04802 [Echinococcus granulosus]
MEKEKEKAEAEMLLACVGVGVGARAHTSQVVCRLPACLSACVLVSAAAAGYIKAGQPMDSRDVLLVLVLSPAAVTTVAPTATAQPSPLTHRPVTPLESRASASRLNYVRTSTTLISIRTWILYTTLLSTR